MSEGQAGTAGSKSKKENHGCGKGKVTFGNERHCSQAIGSPASHRMGKGK